MPNVVRDRRLWRALEAGDHDALADALLAGADPNARNSQGVPPLHYALAHGFELITARLFGSGADMNAATPDGFQPLHIAAMTGSDIIQGLLLNGADANAQNNEGNTPLHYAAMYGNFLATMLLLQRRANPTISNAGGATPVHIAAAARQAEVLELLVAHLEP